MFYEYFEEYEGGCSRESIYGYQYLKHLIKLCLGYWVYQLSKINEEVDEINKHLKVSGKIRLVQKISKQ